MNSNTLVWIGVGAAVIGGLVQVLKSDRLDAILATYNLPSIPKKSLPWIALALSVLAAFLHQMMTGASWQDSLSVALAGSISTATHELFAGDRYSVDPTKPVN